MGACKTVTTPTEKSPKVLQVNKLYYPWIGGVEKVVQDIAEGLKDELTIDVLACRSKGLGRSRSINGVNVEKATSFGIYWGMPLSPTIPFKLFRNSRDYDILHFHLPFPLAPLSYLAMPRREAKVVVTYHSDIVRQEKLMALYGPLLDRFLQKVDVIIATSPDMVENSPYLRRFKDKCEVVPLSIDLDCFLNSPITAPEDELSLENERVVLFVGRLSYYKGVDVLLKAMREVDGHLLVVGDGDLRAKLERGRKKYSLEESVTFVGDVSDEELRWYYKRADVFVLPSIAKSEAFGLVQLEAMAYGKPVVNTELPTGVPYVSKHAETGITVEPGDAKELAGALNRLLNDESLANEFGDNAKKRARELFSREEMLNSIQEIYYGLVD